jgi:Spy/CpxP family protein refolding chaperone
VKNQTFSAQQVGRRLALGAVTLALVVLAADRSGASPTARNEQRFQTQQSTAPRGQATPARHDPKATPQPRVFWWKDPAVIREVSITADQSARIDSIWRKREVDMKSVAKEFERQQDELRRLMAERNVGIDVIGIQHDRVEAQRTTLNKSRTIALYQMSLVLSADQNKILRAIGERNRRDRR